MGGVARCCAMPESRMGRVSGCYRVPQEAIMPAKPPTPPPAQPHTPPNMQTATRTPYPLPPPTPPANAPLTFMTGSSCVRLSNS